MKRKNFYIMVCITLIITLFVGCGKSTASESQSNEEATPEAETYTLGVAAPITGNYAEFGKGFDVATTMAVEEINAAGGVNGKMLELKVMDSKGDGKEATEVARKFSEDEEILAVVGDFSSTCSMAAAPIYEEAGMVQISPTSSHPEFAGMSKYMFGIMGRQDAEGPFVAKYLAQKYKDTKRMGVIYMNNDWGLSAHQNIVNTAEESGLEITALENFVEGEKDFTATLTKIRQTNPDTLCLVMFYNETAIISKQIKQMGWDVKVIGLGPGTSQQIIDLAGKDAEGFATSTPFMATEDNVEAYEFAQEFEKRAGFTLNVHSSCAYDAVYMLASAIENCEEVNRENIATELAVLDDFVGVTGPIKFEEDGDVYRKYLIAEVVDGEWKKMTDYDYYDINDLLKK